MLYHLFIFNVLPYGTHITEYCEFCLSVESGRRVVRPFLQVGLTNKFVSRLRLLENHVYLISHFIFHIITMYGSLLVSEWHFYQSVKK